MSTNGLYPDGVSVVFDGFRALNTLSLIVEPGELRAVIGPNGAGKTTMMDVITGKTRPTTGEVRFANHDLTRLDEAAIATLGIGRKFQKPTVFDALSVFENLELGAYTEAGRRDWKRNLDAILGWFPILAERRSQLAGTLSGGEQQMLAIGRGLASSPRLLMLDEPSMGLARKLIQQIFSIIVEINQQGTTVLLVEQNAAQALRISDVAYVLETGTVVRTGTGAELAADDSIRAAYLGDDGC